MAKDFSKISRPGGSKSLSPAANKSGAAGKVSEFVLKKAQQHKNQIQKMAALQKSENALLIKSGARAGASGRGTGVQARRVQSENLWAESIKTQMPTKTFAELADQAELEYQNYVGSAANIQARQAAAAKYNAEHKWDGLKNALANPTGEGGFGLTAMQDIMEMTDPKEQELKAKADYYKVQAQLEADNAVMEADLKELESWSPEERNMLDLYNANRAGGFGNIMEGLAGVFSGSGASQTAAAKNAWKAQEAFRQLAEKYGEEKVRNLAESRERYQNMEVTKQVGKYGAEAVDGNTGASIGHSVATVPANVAGAVTGPIATLSNLSTRTGRYKTLDSNNLGNAFQVYSGAVRGQVAENISGDEYDVLGNKVRDGGTLRQVGATLYEAGMSAADSLARIFVSGGNEAVSLGLAATGSFSQTVSQASKQGANPVQAVAMGIVDGGLEVLTEKASLDNLFKQAVAGPKNFKTVLKGILKSGAIEVSEEELSFLGSTIMEAAILREKSSYNQRIGALMAQGKTYAEAKATADRELLEEAVNTAVTSFLSGSMMGSGAQVVSAYRTNRIGKDFGKLDLDKADIQDLIDSGLESAPETESHQIAQEIQKQITEGKTPSNYDLARLWQANQQAIAEEEAERAEGAEVLELEEAAQQNAIPPGDSVTQKAPVLATEGGNVTQTGQSVINQGQNVTASGPSAAENAGNVTRTPLSIAEQIRQNRLNQGGIINGTEEFAGATAGTGAGVLSGGSQRHDSAGTGEPAGGMAGGAGQTAQRKENAERNAAAVGRINRIRTLRLPTVSTKELGLPSGTESRSIRVVPQEHWDTEMQQLAGRLYQETGKTVSYVTGRIQVKGADGRTRNVNGVIYGDNIVVRADSLRLSMEQIADHEAYHGRVEWNDAWRPGWLNQEIRRHIVENFSREEFEAVAQKYVEAMAGIYDMDEGLTEAEYQQLLAKVEEEIFADAYAGINAFGAGADRFTSAVNEKMEQLGLGRYKAEEQANGVRETAGPPAASVENENTAEYGGEKYSIDERFESMIDSWDGSTIGFSFVVGETSDALQEAGVPKKQIRWDASKIKTLLAKHNGMTLETVKQIPELLEHPIIVIDSKKGANSKIVMGDLYDEHGKIVTAVLLLTPTSKKGNVLDILKISSAEGRSHIKSLFTAEDGSPVPVRYVDKKRIQSWLNVNRLQLPLHNLDSDSGIIINDSRGAVKNQKKDILEMTDEEFMERYGLKLRAVDEVEDGPDSQTFGENQSGSKERFSVDDTDESYLDAVSRGDLETAQRMVNEAAERWGAYLNNDEANEVFRQDGRVRTFYHGTNTGDFTRFDSRLLGSSSGDLGWFGKGFYFAFSHAEAATYGGRVIPAYLRMSNPYDYSRLYQFKGSDKGTAEYARFAWVYNITKQFPDIAEGQHVWAYPNDAEEGSAVSWKQLTTWMDRIQNKTQFSVEEVELNDGTTAWELRADPKKESLTTASGETFEWTEYGMTQIFATEQDAKEPINQIGAYLKNVMGVDSIPRRMIEKIDFSGALQRAGYDGILQSMSGDEAVVFSPEQIKSSEPVTYDDKGNVIPLSKRFDSNNPDIRYSVDDGTDLTEDDFARVQAALKGQSRNWSENYLRNELGDEGYEQYRAWEKQQAEQQKLENREKVKARNAEKQAARKSVKDPVAESKPIRAKRELRQTVLDLFSVPEGSRAELGAMIDSYADRLLKNGSLTEEDRQHFFDRMYDSGVMTVPAEDYFSQGREILKGGRVYVPESVRIDFGDDWNDIRRRAFGARIYFTSDPNAGGIDAWNHELSEELPGLFNSEETDLRSILERIVEIAEEGQDEKMSLSEFTAMMAGRGDISADEFLDHMERQMDWALRTFAEKARLEISLRDRTGRQIAKERAVHKETAQRQQARKELRELQEKTMKTLRWLNKNRNRAPEELRAAWDEVLGDIDLYAIGAADEMRWSDRYGATWKDLAQMYKDAQKNDPNFLPSEELKMIVGRLDGTKIEEMDLGALNDLYKAAIGLRTEFYNRNNVVNDEMNRLFAEVYRDAKGEIEAAPGGYSGKTMDKLFNLAQLTPMNVLQRMGGWDPNGAFYSMAKQLEKGERDMRAYSVKAQKMLQEFLTENEDWVKKADGQGKDGIWYEVEIPELVALELGKKPQFGATIKVSMTPAQKVHLYLESKNVDNLRHMTGGRTFADKKLYSEGKRQEALAQGKTVRMAPETVKALVSDLTEQEMELARLLEQYYNSFATGEINRISNILYGYDKAMGKNYAPIYTNQSYTKTEFGVFDQTAEGVGNLKGRQYAVNPSYNISAFDAFERHVDQTARFVGMAIPVRNWTTLMNWKVFEDGKVDSTSSVIEHKWGKEGEKYITELINNLQADEDFKSDMVSSAVSKLQSTYITAIFGANPSIVLKQLGSIPLASAYLDARNVPTPAQIKSIDRELIGKYTQDLAWRTMGYATPETRQLKENPNWTETNKFYKFTFGGGAITAMDGWAASVLWPWAENKVRRDYPDLELGTQEQIDKGESPFYKKVAELFEDALSRSQSTSDEIHQSSLRKSKNPITKAFTMFRSDAAQTYNTLRQKIGEAQYYARTGAKPMVQEAAKKAVGAAVISLLLNAMWAESINFLMALWKNKGKYYRDDEEELTFGSVAGEMVSGVLGSFAGIVTGGEEVLEVIGNLLTGEKIYDIETPGIEQLNDLITAVTAAGSSMRDVIAGAVNVAANGGNIGRYFAQNSGKILGSVKDVAETTVMYIPGLPMSGLPVSNIEGYLLGGMKWLSPALGEAYDNLFRDTDKNDLTGAKGRTLQARVGQILRSRKVSKSAETAQVLASLYEAGHKAAMPSNTPSSVSVKGEKHTLNAYQKQVYETVWNSIVADGLDDIVISESFSSAGDEEKTKLLSKLYDYASEMAKAELFDGYEMDGGAEAIRTISKAGLDIAECVEWAAESAGLKQADKFRMLRKWDMPESAKKATVGTLIGTDMKTESGKDSQYAKMLEALKQGATVDEYLDMRLSGTNVEDFLELVESGMDDDIAVELLDDMADLEDDAPDVAKWRICVDFSDDVEDQLTALFGIMTDAQYQKVEIANSFGVVPDAYVTLQELKPKYDADGNGSYKSEEIRVAIEAMPGNLTKEQKAVLWQLATGSTSAKNNPYSKDVGKKVLEAREAAKAKSGS